jgi:membrane peptidoglycan carboxypeptidase
VGLVIGLAILGIIGIALTLPDPERVSLHPGEVQLLDRHGKLIADVGQSGRVIRTEVQLNQISRQLQHATVAAEDRHFYEDRLLGIDFGRLLKASTIDLLQRRPAQGASTITQQLARISLLSGPSGSASRTLGRKIKEAILATEIEQRFSKDEILRLYLNAIYYGHGAYGAEAAAQVYFVKPAKDLTLAQSSFIAGLPQSPSYFDPQINFDGAKGRQKYVLDQMVRDGFASQDDADTAYKEDLQPQLKYKVDAATGPAPHFVEYVRGQLDNQYGADIIAAGGVVVTTSLDLDVQNAANTAIRNGLPKLKGARANNAALLAEDAKTGEILAMVGSADYNDASIAGAVNIAGPTTVRQPGSSFKPYDYLTGIANRKFNTLTTFNDSPNGVPPIKPGKPVVDFDGRYLGTMRLRTALVKSRNVPAEQAMQRAGIQDVIDLAHRMGISTPIQPNLASAIGSSEVRMLDHAEAYGVLATQGYKHDPVPILKVLGSDGKDITIHPGNPQQVIDAAPVYIVNNVLLGYDAEWHVGFDRKMAAKSGTTNVGDCCTGDAWLMAYNPDLVLTAWAGRTSNDKTKSGQTFGLFGVDAGKAILAPFLKSGVFNDAKWKEEFREPPGISHANCSDAGLSQPDVTKPSGGELVLSGDTPSCTAPAPSPSEPSPSPAEPSPTPQESPSIIPPILVSPSPRASPTPHPSSTILP